MFRHFVALISAALLLCVNAYADCRLDAARTETGQNKDGSSLTWVTEICGDAISEERVLLKRGAKTTTILKIEGGSNHTSFFDLNRDGYLEIEVANTCGMVNCDSTIYALDLKGFKVRKVLHYSGLPPDEIAGYFVSMNRVAGYGEYLYSAYEIVDYERLVLGQEAAFTVSVGPVIGPDGPVEGESKCRFSLKKKKKTMKLAEQIAKQVCFEGSKIEFWPPAGRLLRGRR